MGNIGIALSPSDPAGANMLNIFRELGFSETEDASVLSMGDTYMLVVEPLIVPEERYKVPPEPNPYPTDFDGFAETYGLDYIIIASRHWAKSGQPSFTVHPTGNFGKAMYGGRTRELQPTLANPMRDIYLELSENPPKGFKVSMEATHHSPTQFKTPMFFAELGSRKQQWKDPGSAHYLVEAVLEGINTKGKVPVAIGFGGGHYCPTFSVLEEETAFGHIAAKYAIDLLSPELISQMQDKTLDGVNHAVLDKGLKSHQKKKIQVALSKLKIEVK
ncbi:MAG: D-aminoacyl-tRNA deacylase [Candidatus Bathyarchaeota archaeon]|jgi:D-aminoacyl-tRNA deacylase|nr:D-aminoacyl-tRNA deacylase [Candidatus Bathyarchaeota archaeon]MDP6458991.1 D-aminoacyl-tRNA deacylase [Candidatus Bathyarchaeota archaeon]MDP7206973.1 D-aminoacyl-tRNA deacylase [Candidatus Bathyarchaeota archaeon]MDP7443166.1 D-aminoacyl-tRNA deacylase [Candidatus Bathyarchaeota archaeon]|tara:strand:+ start:319 stop:1140 length:822 start_codon:yes stop_codon:yes gene_type:complete